MKDNTKYDLTQEEYQRCLKTAELAIFLNEIKLQNLIKVQNPNPKSVFIVAQPGAGKTGLRHHIEKENSALTEIDPDEVAMYHKYYNEILQEFPEESYSILQRFIKPALDTYLRQRAVQLRADMISEGTFASTNAYIEILDFQKNGGKAKLGMMQPDGEREEIVVPGGYQIEVNILAVDRFESLLSSYEREQYFIEYDLPPRAVTPNHHDRAYNNMLDTIRIIESQNLSDRMRVFKRGKEELEPELVYETGSNRYSSATEAIISERNLNKTRILSNPEGFKQRIKKLKQRVDKNKDIGNAQILMAKIEELEREFEQELEKYTAQEK